MTEEDEGEGVIARATALVNLVSKLNTDAKSAISGAHIKDALEHVSTAKSPQIHPSALQPPSALPSTAMFEGLSGFTPTFARHNDAKYYPNIICVICKEWVCSRSRRLHVGAHFDYRKHKCPYCSFTHSKEIFVVSHMKRIHDKQGQVEQKDDPVIEERIEEVCNMSIAMTRDILRGQYDEKIYRSYPSSYMPRSQIHNKERKSRTKVLTAVTDATNRQLLS
ncbi:hypothetical protein TELCIR_15920 [Teladorsagia circumcincta]|uniref:C2H2-type domain-containing protein n=1 Tax=Teladorsagia circumcincta TaxID=45464 RepID=A0A2G9TX88_TELCI|nr:hypothetical protein TELCIR_15920 [Teladorsagia circumcincta]